MSYTYVRAKENNKTEGTAITIYSTFLTTEQCSDSKSALSHFHYLSGILVLFLQHYVYFMIVTSIKLQMRRQKQKSPRKIGTGPSGSVTRSCKRGRGSGPCVRVWGTRGTGRSVTKPRPWGTTTISRKRKWRHAKSSRKSGGEFCSVTFSGILYLEFEDNVVFWQLIKFLVQWFLITPNSLLFWFVAKL